MIETVSIVVPLQTLFGWPEAPAVTPLEALGLLAGVPIMVIAAIFAVAKGNAMMRAAKLGPGPQPSDPVWMGGRAKSIMGSADDEVAVDANRAPRARGVPHHGERRGRHRGCQCPLVTS